MKLLSIEDLINGGSSIEADLRILFKKNEELQFLDVGACTGEDSIIYSNLFPKAKIIAFEPLPKNLEIMRQHIKAYSKEGSIQIENCALSNEEGDFDFYVSGGSPYKNDDLVFTTIRPKEWNKSSSLLKPSSLMNKEIPWLKFDERIRVNTIRLDKYLNQNKIEKVDFIHMDVQGAELKVLLGLEKLIRNVKVIWLEVENVELYENQPLKHEIQSFLLKNNFYLAKDTSKGKTAGDCLFINGFLLFLGYKLFKVIQIGSKIFNRF